MKEDAVLVEMEILYGDGCGRRPAARDAVSRVACEEGIPAVVTETLIGSPEEAEARRFPGSPTIRINGHDVEPEADTRGRYGLG